MRHLSVKNLEKFQHYKHRNPSWIKLYSSLWVDRDFARLPDLAKLLYFGLLTIASQTDNRIPADCGWIANRLGLHPTDDNDSMDDGRESDGHLTDRKRRAYGARTRRALKTLERQGFLTQAASTEESKSREEIEDSRVENAPASAGGDDRPPKAEKPQEPEQPKNERPQPETLWPEGFALTEPMVLYAKEKHVEPHREFEAFRDNALAKGLKYRDWEAAWRTWCRRAVEFGRASPPPVVDERWKADAPPLKRDPNEKMVDIRPFLREFTEGLERKAKAL